MSNEQEKIGALAKYSGALNKASKELLEALPDLDPKVLDKDLQIFVIKTNQSHNETMKLIHWLMMKYAKKDSKHD